MESFVKQCSRKIDTYCRKEENVLRFKYSCIGTVFFCLAAHAFAYFNLIPTHDALNHTFDLARTWEISLGRFLIPVYEKIRGPYIMPWLIGMLTMFFSSLASYLVADILEIKKRWFVFLSAGFLIINVTTTNLTAVFFYCLDNYSLSFLFACIGVFVIKHFPIKASLPLSVLFFTLSMGIYQSYILVAVTLFIIQGIQAAINDGNMLLKQHSKEWITYISSLVLSAFLYLVIYKLVLKFCGISASSSSNSISSLASLNPIELPNRIVKAYKNFFYHFFVFWHGDFSLAKFINVLLLVFSSVIISRNMTVNKTSLLHTALILIGILIYPAITQAMGILEGKPTINFLTAYAMYLMYPTMLSLFDHYSYNIFRKTIYILCGFLLFNGIVFSNEIYTFQKIQYDKTLLHMTRIINDIDNIENYSAGNTLVVPIGNFNASTSTSNINNHHEPDGYSMIRGLGKTSITYAQTMRSFIQNMGEKINMSIDNKEIAQYKSLETVKSMPVYPSPGYCQMLNDVLIVKISD